MLNFLRKKKRSWVILILLGTIVFVFVLWGVGSFTDQPTITNLATVNEDVITIEELDYHYQRALKTYQNIFQGKLSREALENLNLRAGVLEELIQKYLLLQEAANLGLETTDDEVLDSITNNPAFQIDGQFSKSLYRRILRSERTTPIQFESEQKENLTIRKLDYIVQHSVRVSDTELKSRYRIDKEKINLYFIRLVAKDYLEQTNVTKANIKNYYQQNKETLKEPLKIQVEYLSYPLARFSSKDSVSLKKIKDYYNAYRNSKFRLPKAVRLRHILIRVPLDGNLKKEKNKARDKAHSLLQKARETGVDFANLAKDHSEDPSASRGGDVGFIHKGQLIPALEKVAFQLKKGRISDLIETSLGFHIVKVEETREEQIKSLQETRKEIVEILTQLQTKEAAFRAAEEDRERALDGTDLCQIAIKSGLTLKTSKFFTRYEALKEFEPVKDFNKTSFSLFPKQISPVMEGPKSYYLVRLKERRTPHTPPLDKIYDKLEKKLTAKEAMNLATKKAQSLLDELKEKNNLTDLANNHGLKIEETGWFLRSNTTIPKIGSLLELKPGGIPLSPEVPIADRIYSQQSAVLIIVFKERQKADMGDFEKDKTRFMQEILTEKKRRTLQKFIENLKSSAKIEILPEFLTAS